MQKKAAKTVAEEPKAPGFVPADDTQKQDLVMSSEELSIARRVATMDEEWKDIGEDSVMDFTLNNDPFELPPPALEKKKQKQFAFRWIERDAKRLDTVRSKPVPFKWWICNRTSTPFLEGYFDPILGCVSRLDQMLVFKPFWMFVKEMEFKQRLAEGVNAKAIENLDGEERGNTSFVASRRSGLDSKSRREQVTGSDEIQFDEAEYDKSRGVVHGPAEASDLVVD
jgi:hypothetical protein